MSSNYNFNYDKIEEYGYEDKYPTPSNDEQLIMVLNAIKEDIDKIDNEL